MSLQGLLPIDLYKLAKKQLLKQDEPDIDVGSIAYNKIRKQSINYIKQGKQVSCILFSTFLCLSCYISFPCTKEHYKNLLASALRN